MSHHRPYDCLSNGLFRRRSKQTAKLCVTGLCEGNSPVTSEFPAQLGYCEGFHRQFRKWIIVCWPLSITWPNTDPLSAVQLWTNFSEVGIKTAKLSTTLFVRCLLANVRQFVLPFIIFVFLIGLKYYSNQEMFFVTLYTFHREQPAHFRQSIHNMRCSFIIG